MPESELSQDPSHGKAGTSKEVRAISSMGTTLREFFVDLLGSLVPGFFFISLATPLLVWLLLLFRDSISVYMFLFLRDSIKLYSGIPIVSLPVEFITSFRIELIAAALVFAYVLGSVFFRQDTKVPDQESAAYILANITDENEVGRLVIQPPDEEWKLIKAKKRQTGEKLFTKEQANRWATGEGGQYPYSHLKQYLERRGLGHLAAYVAWDWTKEGDHDEERKLRDLRSKMFINVLKARLQYCVPEKCSEIIRNEAHIRMMSSVWYACKALQKLYWWILIASVLPIVVIVFGMHNFRIIFPLLMQIAALALFSAVPAKLLRLPIKKFIHYQRVREIVFVLETAWFAQECGQKSILSHLPGETSSGAFGPGTGTT